MLENPSVQQITHRTSSLRTMQNVLKDNLSHKLSDKTVDMIHTLSQNREKNITPMSNPHSKAVSIIFNNHSCVMDAWRRMS